MHLLSVCFLDQVITDEVKVLFRSANYNFIYFELVRYFLNLPQGVYEIQIELPIIEPCD